MQIIASFTEFYLYFYVKLALFVQILAINNNHALQFVPCPLHFIRNDSQTFTLIVYQPPISRWQYFT